MKTPSPPDARPVAIITGAGSGIGLAAAHRLRHLGFRLALVGRREAPLRDAGLALGVERHDWIALPRDIADPAHAAAVVDETVAAFGRLDVLVNNAGWSPLKRVQDISADEVQAVFAVNAVGPIISLCRAAAHMAAHGGGRIVNVSSRATRDPFPGLGVYGAAKAAMNLIARAVANDAGDRGIRCFTVAPGAVETPLLRSLFDTDAIPTARTLTPDAVARVIAACASGERDAEAGETFFVSPG